MDYKRKNECRCCGEEDLYQFIDLGAQPLANDYHDGKQILQAYPLGVNFCRTCSHTQLTVVVDPETMFKNYFYVSGTTRTLRDYFDWFAQVVLGYSTKKNGRVLDIACNDGSQLDSFKRLGWETYGVDPAENLVPLARQKGHTVTIGYWGTHPDDPWFDEPFDILIAQNVFAHTDDVFNFLIASKNHMHDDSTLFIQTSQANMYVNGEFDTIYHEHLSFFNTQSMSQIVARAGLVLARVEKTAIHGTSYVFIIKKKLDRPELNNVADMMAQEKEAGLYNLTTYERFGERAQDTIRDFKYMVKAAKLLGYFVVGYGAAAKGMTVLNAGEIKLDWIVDDNIMKQQKLTPGTNIPIRSVESVVNLEGQGKVLFIPLAWNFYTEIRQRIKDVRDSDEDRFLKYFPSIEITP